MTTRKSLLAVITAITLGCSALTAQARTVGGSIISDPQVAQLACLSLCNIVRANVENACEADVRADGEATTDELIGCMIQGIKAQGDCIERYCGE